MYYVLSPAINRRKSCEPANQGSCCGTDINSDAQYWIIKCHKWVLADNEMELGVDYFTQSV